MKYSTPTNQIHPDSEMFRVHPPQMELDPSDDSLRKRLERARQMVQPIIDRERRGELVGRETIDFLMR